MTRRSVGLWLAAVGAAALVLASCGSDQQAHRRAVAAAAHTHMLRTGARVFFEHCQTCHPLLGAPNTEVHTDAPPLDLDQVRPTRAYVGQRLASGGVGMGGFGPELSGAERSAVVAYVLAVGGRDVVTPRHVGAADLRQGRALYDEHCQRCHAIAGRAATRPNPIWPGTDFQVVQPSVLYVEQKVRDGQRQAMPSFRGRLTMEQIRAVALYVNATAR